MSGWCGNCGKDRWVVKCVDVAGLHTHPKAWNDLTPVPCTHGLCRRCERNLRRNLWRPLADQGAQT